MLKKIFKYGILIIGITMLAVLPAFAADQTDVVITRANSSVGNNRPVSVYIDDVRLGTIMPGKHLETRVNNRSHTIAVKITINNDDISSDFYFTADGDKTLLFRIIVTEKEEKGLILSKKVPVISVTLVED
jgi:hypothetical protein